MPPSSRRSTETRHGTSKTTPTPTPRPSAEGLGSLRLALTVGGHLGRRVGAITILEQPPERARYPSSHGDHVPVLGPHLAQPEFAADILNRFHWHLSVEHVGSEIRLLGGELLIGRFPSMEELQAFTAGMALALSLLPEAAVEAIDQWAGGE